MTLRRTVSDLPADLFLPKTVAVPLTRGRPRAARYCRPLDGYREADERCRVQCYFRTRAAVAGTTRLESAVLPARTTRDAQSKDRRFAFEPRSTRASKHQPPRRCAS